VLTAAVDARSALRARHARARSERDAGITLIELVVAMTLATIVATLATMLFVTSSNVNAKTTDANVASSSARAALDSWASLISLADSPTIYYNNSGVPQPGNTSQAPAAGSSSYRFVKVSATELTFWADIDNRLGSAASPCPNGSCTSAAQPTGRGPATYVDLAWVPTSSGSSTGALVETRYVPGSTTTVAATRTLIPSGVTPGTSTVPGFLFTWGYFTGCYTSFYGCINSITISFQTQPNNGMTAPTATASAPASKTAAPQTYTTTVTLSETS